MLQNFVDFAATPAITAGWLNSIDSSAAGSCSVFDYMTDAQVADVIARTYSLDVTAAINTAYAAAAVSSKQLRFPAGGYKITSTLNWNQSVDVIGLSMEHTVIRKDTTAAGADFIGVHIYGAGQQSRYQDFTVAVTGAVNPAIDGLQVTASARMYMLRVQGTGHGRYGIAFIDTGVNGMGVFSRYQDLVTNLNGSDGLYMIYQYASRLTGLNSSQNGGYGYNNPHGNSVNATDIVCENNVLGGSNVDNCVANMFQLYGEANTGADIQLTSSSVRNFVIAFHEDAVSDLSDEGTNNVVLDIGLFPMFSCPNIGRIPRTANAQGRDLYVFAGTAGPGAVGHKGGKLTLQGGNAAGNTLARGNDVQTQGGDGIAGGQGGDNIMVGGTGNGAGGYGNILLTNATEINVDPGATNRYLTLALTKGPIRVGGSNVQNASISMSFQSLNQFIQLPKMVNASVLALDTTNGQAMFGFNQTAGVLCPVFWDGAAWQKVSFTPM